MKPFLSLSLFLFFLFLSSSNAQEEQGVGECVNNYLSSQSSWGGEVGLPGSDLYNTSLNIDNKYAISFPAVVLAPRTEKDISMAINSSLICNSSSFSSASGGHSAAGYALNTGGIVLNLKIYFNAITVGMPEEEKEGQITIQGGAIWSDIYNAALPTGYIPIGGGCPEVGVSGFTLGGGWSFLSRSYGLGADNLISARYILANGSAVTASHSSNPDLYWAAKGGGGGNFGVATSFTLQMHKPKTSDGLMTIGQLCWDPFSPKNIELWKLWLDDYSALPAYMDLAPCWLPINPVDGSRMFCITVICNGEEKDCNDIIAPYLDRKPQLNSVERQSYLEWSIGHVGVTDAQSGNLYLTSGVMQQDVLTVEMFTKLMIILKEAPSSQNLILFHICGGRINEIPATATPFPHRSCQLVIQAKAIWNDGDNAQANIDWVNDVRTFLLPSLSGSYVNYIDPNFPDWETAYYGENYDRLESVQREYDPDHFFIFPQAIGT